MKVKTSTWLLYGMLPSMGATFFFAYSAKYFQPTQNDLWLYQVFVVMTALSACAYTIFALLSTTTMLVNFGKTVEQAHENGMKLSDWKNPLISLGLGVFWLIFLLYIGVSVMLSVDIAVFTFIFTLLYPLRKRIYVQLKEECQLKKKLPTRLPTEDKSKSAEQNVDIHTIVNSSLTSNVMVNVVLPQVASEQSQASLDTPPHDRLDVVPQSDTYTNSKDVSSVPTKNADSDSDSNTALIFDNNDFEPLYCDGEEVMFPQNFPAELRPYPIRVIFVELIKHQILDKNFQPYGQSKAQMSILADVISECFSISKHWKTFEALWNMKNLRQSHHQTKDNCDLNKDIFAALEDAAKDSRVCTIKKYNLWLVKYRNHNRD